jgi:ABC-2 type transport system ATP-binding protein
MVCRKAISSACAGSTRFASTAAPLVNTVIEVKGVVKTFGDVTAIDRVSFEVRAGETFGVAGPVGAGKSTLFRILATLVPPTSGSATINGFDVVQGCSDVRRSIGVVPQTPASDFELTVAENLLTFARLRGVPRAKQPVLLDELLEALELTHCRHEPVRTLAAGVIRRVEMARSLLHAPRVLLLDEPTAGLDQTSRASTGALLRKIASARGLTVLLTAQDADEARTMCDRVVMLDRGRLKA